MFGSEGWSKDQLGDLLRLQSGHMERTCEIILQNDGVPAEQVLKSQNQDTSNDEALARRLAQGEVRPGLWLWLFNPVCNPVRYSILTQ